MKQLFTVMTLLTVLGCIAFVSWQLAIKPESDNQQQQAEQEQVVDVQNITANEKLLVERRALARIIYKQDQDLTPEIRRAFENPSDALLDAIVEEYIAGNLSFEQIEEDFAIIDDWLDEPLIDYLTINNPLQLVGMTLEPLPEPANYFVTTESYREYADFPVFRTTIDSQQDGLINVYAIDTTGAVTGVAAINEDLIIPVQEIPAVSVSSFAGSRGINVDLNAPDEFTIMLRGTGYGVDMLDYTYSGEGKSYGFYLPILVTPDMLASATWSTKDGKTDLYRWRIDYDGDGKIDFLLSHNETSESQAVEMLDFVIATGQDAGTSTAMFEANREFLIKYLTDEKYR